MRDNDCVFASDYNVNMMKRKKNHGQFFRKQFNIAVMIKKFN